MFFLASCGGGLSEKEKNEIENFEKEWDVNIQMGEMLSEKLHEAEKIIFAPTDTTLNDLTISIANYQLENEKQYRIIEKKYEHFNLEMNKEYKNWVEFKNKAMKDEMEYEEVSSFLESKRKIMKEFQSDISKLLRQTDKLLSEIPSK
jgi:hypothetical protein